MIAKRIDGLKACRDKATAIIAEKAEHDAKQGKFKAEKDQVRKMLDISGPEHVKRVEGIIKAALNYIDRSQVTVSELRDELGGIEGQADKLVKINSQMITVVAILDKGIDLATAANKEKVQALSTVREGEDTLARLERERKKNDFERHVTALLDSGRSTKKTVADLQKDAVDANTFHDALGKQNVNLRELSSDGIASVATSLNTTIQALNNSALNEASESVRDSMRAMNAVTDDVSNKEVIRQALQVDEASQADHGEGRVHVEHRRIAAGRQQAARRRALQHPEPARRAQRCHRHRARTAAGKHWHGRQGSRRFGRRHDAEAGRR